MFAVNTDTRAGRMLAAGRLTCTFRSPSGQHITITAKCRKPRDGHGWETCPLDQAKVVFFEVPNAEGGFNDRVAKFTAKLGFTPDPRADRARVYAARMLGRYAQGLELPNGLEVFEEDRCGRCGRTLTDPVSIERGIGPECYGAMTGSAHQVKGETLRENDLIANVGERDPEGRKPEVDTIRQQVIEDGLSSDLMRQAASFEATYMGNHVGGRPSDSAANAVDHLKRGLLPSSPTAKRVIEQLEENHAFKAATAWLEAKRQAARDGDPGDRVGNAAAWLADALREGTPEEIAEAGAAFEWFSYRHDREVQALSNA